MLYASVSQPFLLAAHLFGNYCLAAHLSVKKEHNGAVYGYFQEYFKICGTLKKLLRHTSVLWHRLRNIALCFMLYAFCYMLNALCFAPSNKVLKKESE